MQASAPHAQRGFSANNQLLTGEALAGAATRHGSKRPMWFRLRLNPFIAGRFKIRIPDKGLGKEGPARSHMCRDQIEERQGLADVLPAGRHRQGGRLWGGLNKFTGAPGCGEVWEEIPLREGMPADQRGEGFKQN